MAYFSGGSISLYQLPEDPKEIYFARRCNQDLAYSRRFLELHGTPTHQSTWGIPLTAWRKYDAALHARTSSTSTLLELNMLDEQDTVDADQQELQEFLTLQQNKAAVAAKCKCNRSPMPVAGPSSKKIRLDAPKKCSHRKSPAVEVNAEPPRCVRLVVPPVCSLAPTSLPAPPPASPSLMGVLNRDLDQFRALDEALLGAPGQSLLERFRKLQEDLQDATREQKVTVEKLSTSNCKNLHLMTNLLYQQGLVDESNALATRQCCLVEQLQEEVHRARDHAAFIDQMIKEYPDEGYYEVVLPPLSQLEGDVKSMPRASIPPLGNELASFLCERERKESNGHSNQPI
ncbi:hypothetical protein GG344DRAFT_84351 [Lentinula edodes]|nr:hypothetical protein GG344DRAFT_84351 [Lentinula edodes]